MKKVADEHDGHFAPALAQRPAVEFAEDDPGRIDGRHDQLDSSIPSQPTSIILLSSSASPGAEPAHEIGGRLQLNRQETIFQQHGPMRWCCKPLYGSLKDVLFQSKVIGTDDTSVKALDSKLPFARNGLSRIVSHPIDRIAKLLPHNWAPAQVLTCGLIIGSGLRPW